MVPTVAHIVGYHPLPDSGPAGPGSALSPHLGDRVPRCPPWALQMGVHRSLPSTCPGPLRSWCNLNQPGARPLFWYKEADFRLVAARTRTLRRGHSGHRKAGFELISRWAY